MPSRSILFAVLEVLPPFAEAGIVSLIISALILSRESTVFRFDSNAVSYDARSRSRSEAVKLMCLVRSLLCLVTVNIECFQ